MANKPCLIGCYVNCVNVCVFVHIDAIGCGNMFVPCNHKSPVLRLNIIEY